MAKDLRKMIRRLAVKVKALQDGGGGGWTVARGDITDKPTTFAPAAHTHPISDIANLQSTLDGKADESGAYFTGAVIMQGTRHTSASNIQYIQSGDGVTSSSRRELRFSRFSSASWFMRLTAAGALQMGNGAGAANGIAIDTFTDDNTDTGAGTVWNAPAVIDYVANNAGGWWWGSGTIVIDDYLVLRAEENAALGNWLYEWSRGNGDEAASGGGGAIPLPGDRELVGLALRLSGNGTATVEVRKDGVSNGDSISISGSKKAYQALSNGTIFTSADSIDFYTISGSGNSWGNRVFAAFKRSRTVNANVNVVIPTFYCDSNTSASASTLVSMTGTVVNTNSDIFEVQSSTRVVCKQDGTYKITVDTSSASFDNDTITTQIRINGSTVKSEFYSYNNDESDTMSGSYFTMHHVATLTANDYVEVYLQESGGLSQMTATVLVEKIA